ncbi:MAG TPA: hypothetical protein VMK12_25990 [Anaeromyxobacteraceae bacterium]|nr:hypothetical protein [Anaeromyxobacteraceae bacterium]
MNPNQVIERLLEAHNIAVGSRYVVTRYPDTHNRGSREIDAYAESPGLPPLAIEHTKVESLEYQDRDSAWFVGGLGQLETELNGAFPFWLGIELPYRNVEPRQDWRSIRGVLKEWLLASAPNLPDGRTEHAIPGVPFSLAVWKNPSLPVGVFLIRHVPPGDREALLLARMHDRLDHKYQRLGQYRREGARTINLLDSRDIALVSPQSLYRAFLRATRERPRPDLDQVWLAWPPGAGACTMYCFHGPEEVMVGVNPANFRFGPQFSKEWLPDGT